MNLITVNNFVAHLIKEISITKYGSNKELIPTFSPYEIYQYSDSMLKHLPKDALKKLEKTLQQTGCIFQRNNNQQKNPQLIWFYCNRFKCNSNSNSKKKSNAKDLNIDE